MAEITGPVVATTLILVAVFAPVGFVSGVTGALYRQFATTISVSVVISAVNALTLSPALCAIMLKPPQPTRFVGFKVFNRGFNYARDRYGDTVGLLSRRLALPVLGLLVVFGASYLFFRVTPSAFLPAEDQGYFFLNVQLPNGASLERTDAVIYQVSTMLRRTPGIAHVIGVSGYSIVTSAQGGGWRADDRDPQTLGSARGKRVGRRHHGGDQAEAGCPALRPMCRPSIRPSIPGVSATGGINFVLEAQNGESYEQLASVSRNLILASNQSRAIGSGLPGFSDSERRCWVTVNPDRAELLGVSPQAAYATLAGLSRLAIRQRLQLPQLRLPGDRAGGPAVPQQDQRHRSALRAQQQRRDGADHQHRGRCAWCRAATRWCSTTSIPAC